MKTRIVIYICLFVLLCVGLIYVAQRKQQPTGLSRGERIYMRDIEEEGFLEPLEEIALERIAELSGLPVEALEIINEAERTFQFRDHIETVKVLKIKDLYDGKGFIKGIDERGEVLDLWRLEELETEEYEGKIDEHGKLTPALHEQIHRASADELIEAVVWLRVPDYLNMSPYELIEHYFSVPFEELIMRDDITEDEIERFLEENYNWQTENIRQINESFRYRLEERFPEITCELSETTPFVYLLANPEIIEQIGAPGEFPEVDRIYESSLMGPHLNITRESIGVENAIKSKGVRYTGDGIKVAVVESLSCVSRKSGYFKQGKYPITEAYKNYSYGYYHATKVAGIIRSFDVFMSYMGIAYDVRLWVTRASEKSLKTFGEYPFEDRLDAAIKWGVRVINASFGTMKKQEYPESFARYCDNLVYKYLVTIATSAGNDGDTSAKDPFTDFKQNCHAYVGSPANAYNVIAVGNYIDRVKTSSNQFKKIDSSKYYMYKKSSWKSPKSAWNDREKPEVAAPGWLISPDLDWSPWVSSAGSGAPAAQPATSWSAPVVTGAVAVMMEYEVFLKIFPQLVKAVLMASAIDNIKRGKYDTSKSPAPGGIRVDQAIRILKKESGGRGLVGLKKPEWINAIAAHKTINLYSELRTRIAIAWCTDTSINAKNYSKRPTADIDLYLYEYDGSKIDNKGKKVAQSASFDNTFEVIDFTPEKDGKYVMEIEAVWIGNPGGVGVGYAWWQKPPLQYKITDDIFQSDDVIIIPPDDISEIDPDDDGRFPLDDLEYHPDN